MPSLLARGVHLDNGGPPMVLTVLLSVQVTFVSGQKSVFRMQRRAKRTRVNPGLRRTSRQGMGCLPVRDTEGAVTHEPSPHDLNLYDDKDVQVQVKV